MNVCCFIGHRKINITEELVLKLNDIIEHLIVKNNVQIFLFGSKSVFNDLCVKVVTSLKKKYDFIKLIYVRAEYPYIDKEYKDFLLMRYDETYFLKSLLTAGNSIYIKRNYYMIDKSNYCIFYYDKNYTTCNRMSNNNLLTSFKSNSGTKIAYDYAIKTKKNIINLFNLDSSNY